RGRSALREPAAEPAFAQVEESETLAHGSQRLAQPVVQQVPDGPVKDRSDGRKRTLPPRKTSSEFLRNLRPLAREGRRSRRLRLTVQVADGDRLVKGEREQSPEGQPKAELGVEDVVEILPQQAEFLEDIPSPEGG